MRYQSAESFCTQLSYLRCHTTRASKAALHSWHGLETIRWIETLAAICCEPLRQAREKALHDAEAFDAIMHVGERLSSVLYQKIGELHQHCLEALSRKECRFDGW